MLEIISARGGLAKKYKLKKGVKILSFDNEEAEDALDYIFYDGKYYFVIKGERRGGTEEYSSAELFFGRDSLKNPALKSYAEAELIKRERYFADCADPSARKKIANEISLLKEVLE